METEILIEKTNKKYLFWLIFRLVIVIIVIGMLIGYFLSPISTFNNYKLYGNNFMTIDDLYEFIDIKGSDSLYSVSESELDSRLSNVKILKNYSYKLTPFGVTFNIEDSAPCAKYNSSLLDENGSIINTSLYQDAKTKKYLTAKEINVGEFINEPIANSNLSSYLLIAGKVNLDNKYIYYLESLINDNKFAFYYNIDDNLFLKIILNYSSSISLNAYQENLDYTNDELMQVTKAVIEKKEIKHNDQFEFDYYDVNLSLLDENGTSKFEF